ncbi:MAG TPA: RidA family protein [Steroidobacteraceae bacterium]
MSKRALTIWAIGLIAAGAGASAADAGRTFYPAAGPDPKTPPPYSSGILVDGTYYVAGTLGVDPATGIVPSDPEAEARFVLDAVKQTLARGGLTMDDLVSVTVYCTDLDLYDKFNAVYRTYFHEHFPTRAFIGAAKLVRGAHFEVAAIAVASQAPKK